MRIDVRWVLRLLAAPLLMAPAAGPCPMDVCRVSCEAAGQGPVAYGLVVALALVLRLRGGR